MFDYCLVLAQGRTVYYGPTSSAADHFTKLEHTSLQYTHSNSVISVLPNPADQVMAIVTRAQQNSTSTSGSTYEASSKQPHTLQNTNITRDSNAVSDRSSL